MSETFDFLESVLPPQGYPVISHSRTKEDGSKFFNNFAFKDIRSAAQYVADMELPDYEVYFACSTYRDVVDIGDSNRFGVTRSQANVQFAKSVWCDIDIKDDGHNHANRKQALLAVKAACVALDLPMPMIVLSGSGLHLYWIFSDAVGPAVWKEVAVAMQKALLSHGVMLDRTVTTDSARILRPVGSVWKKAEPRVVKLYRPMPPDSSHDAAWYLRKLAEFIDHKASGPFGDAAAFNSGIATEWPEKEVDAQKVADQCRQVGMMRESKGDVSYEHWRKVLGLLTFCNDTEELADDWSSLREETGHSQNNWEEKLRTWGSNPPLCESFRKENPSGCNGCVHADKIKTPLTLGTVIQTTTAKAADGTVVEKHKSDWIHGYEWCETTKRMVAIRKNEDGIPERVPFCSTRWWVENYSLEQGVATLILNALHERFGREGIIEKHEIPMGLVGGGGRELNSHLAKNMITDTSGRRLLSQDYLRDYAQHLKNNVREIRTYRQFGWINDGEFLLGDKVVTPKEELPVHLGGSAATKAGVWDTSKKKEDWINVVEDTYNRPNGEPYQFVLCAALGSALVPLLGLEEFSGIPIAVTSDESGYGKTTVCCLGLAAWGAVHRGLNVLPGDEASPISIEIQASIFNNLPSLFDEQTNRDGAFTSNFLYMLSNGTARSRGTPDGKLREPSPPWKGLTFITGNRNIFYKLTENRANPEAAQMRCFEISLDSYPRISTLDNAQERSQALNEVRSGCGAIGVEFVRYVMNNREAVRKVMKEMPKAYFKNMHHDKERFYVNAAVCAITAGQIMKDLGFVRFDMENLASWSRDHILKLRTNVDALRNTTEENLGRCLTTLCQRLLVTDYMHGHGDEIPFVAPKGDVAGRVAQKHRKCYITLQSITDWCSRTGVQWTKLRAGLAAEGFLDPEMLDGPSERYLPSIRVNLGKGVKGYTTGVSRVVAIEYDKVASTLDELTNNDNVVAMR